ncbi:MAG TPA: hypothetical protein VF777_02240 [Phycisphaerales bacterium]
MSIARTTTFALAALCLAHASRAADEPELYHFIDRDLVRVSGELIGVTDKAVQYRDSVGRSRSIDRSTLLAFYSRRHHGAAAPTSISIADNAGEVPGVLRLTDGQLVPGFLLTTVAHADSIAWRSRRVGPFNLPLDAVSAISFADSEPIEKSTSDVVLLTNADRMEGFVESIGGNLVMEVQGAKQTVPLERVASIRLAARQAAFAANLVALTDGSILAARSIAAGPSPSALTVEWSLAGEGASGVLDLGAIDAVVFDPQSIRPLASCEIVRHEPLQARRWAPPPVVQPADQAPVGLASITIDGPAACEWRLPANASRLRATLSLPESARPWGNTTVAASLIPRSGTPTKPQAFELTTDKPETELSLDCTGMERVRLEVKGRGYDQVQARVVLLEPVLRITTK